MKFPKYQWIQEQPTPSCGWCDDVVIPNDITPQFQLTLGATSVINTFPTNPFDAITATDLYFSIVPPFIFKRLVFYISGTMYVIDLDPLYSASQYTYIQSGNKYFVRIAVGATTLNTIYNYITFFNNVIDANHGVTTTFVTPLSYDFKMANVPVGSYFGTDGLATLITGITPSGNLFNNFHWESNVGMVYKNVSAASVGFYDRFTFKQSINVGLNVITFSLSAAYNFDIQITLNDGTNPPTVITKSISTGAGSMVINYTAILASLHTVEFRIINTTYPDGLIVRSVNIANTYAIDDVEVEGCSGMVLGYDSSVSYNDTNTTALVTLNDILPNIFRVKITDTNSNVITSRWYKVEQDSDCTPYIRVQWHHTCDFRNLKYNSMPFVNVLLLTGFLAKTGLENVENVEGIAYNGRKFNVYRNTQATNEIKIHPYLSETMDMIERIFDHNLIEINGVKMNTVEACKVSEIDLGVYTAAAELIVSESEIISTNCCC